MFLKITTFDVFYFWRVLLVITTLLFMIIWLCSPIPICTYPSIHFRKIDMTKKNSGGFIRSTHPPPPPTHTHTHTHIVQGGWCHEWLSPGTVALAKNSERTNYVVCKKFFLKRILQVQVEKISPIWDIVVKTFYP